MEYESEQRGYDDEPRGYDRDRSRSPRIDRRDNGGSRARSASPMDRDERGPRDGRDNRDQQQDNRSEDDDGARNPGSNLFVTGIHPSLTEEEVTALFQKFGEVEKCNIMRDPHTKDSRGFGFVKMVTAAEADAAKEGLQGEVHQGRTLSIEKARRARPRTPTPGKYFGPPKREFRGGFRGGRGYSDRYDDRRGGGGYGRRDDYGGGYRGSRYNDRDDRGGDRGYSRRDRDDYGSRGVDRYASRDDRYSSRGDDRRGGYYERSGPPAGGAPAYGDAPRQDAYTGGGGRSYDDRGEYYRS